MKKLLFAGALSLLLSACGQKGSHSESPEGGTVGDLNKCTLVASQSLHEGHYASQRDLALAFGEAAVKAQASGDCPSADALAKLADEVFVVKCVENAGCDLIRRSVAEEGKRK